MRFAVTIFAILTGFVALWMKNLIGFESIFGIMFTSALGFFGYEWYVNQPEEAPSSNKKLKTKLEEVKPSKSVHYQQARAQPVALAVTPGPSSKSFDHESHTRSSGTKSSSSGGKRIPRRMPSSLLKGNVTSPALVIYSNGVPKDVGFGRGDQQQQLTGVWLSAKIYIPEVKGYSFIGRILGPRGISVRRLESETECKILIRGRGSIKDEKREQVLMNRNGWSHLHDKLHVLLLANDESEKLCRERLKGAVQVIQRLLIPQYDEYKRQQLMHLAILNGTYRP